MLTTAQFKRLVELVSKAFSKNDLRMLLRLEVGINIDSLTALELPLDVVVFNVVEALLAQGIAGKFVSAVVKARPERADIQTECGAMLIAMGYLEQSNATEVEIVTKGLEQFERLLDNPEVKSAAEDAKDLLNEVAARIATLKAYKVLHDQLHLLQGDLRNLELAVEGMPGTAPYLEDSIHVAAGVVEDATKAVPALPAQPSFIRASERAWITRLSATITKLRQARTQMDQQLARAVLTEVKSLLMWEPSRIDALISAEARALRLESLADLFKAVADTPGPNQSIKDEMSSTQRAVAQVQSTLRSRVNRHQDWQEVILNLVQAGMLLASISEILARAHKDGQPPPPDDGLLTVQSDFDSVWKGILEVVGRLQNADSGTLWVDTTLARSSAIQKARLREDWGRLVDQFSEYRQVCGEQFLSADGELKAASTEVEQVGKSIETLLNKL